MKYVKLLCLLFIVQMLSGCNLVETGPGIQYRQTTCNAESAVSASVTGYDVIPCASDFKGTLRHLMYKTGLVSNWYANTDLPGYDCFLNGNNPNNWNEKEKEHIFLMEYWKPPVENIKHIVFLTAGQQGNLLDRMAPPNIVTGQYKDYHDWDQAPIGGINSWKYMKNAVKEIQWKSVAGQIIADGTYNGGRYFGFTPANTYLAIAFDSCNYWELDINQKNNLSDDFLEWLFRNAGNNTQGRIGTIYLAGSSMGGALCTTMAYKMRHIDQWVSRAKSARIVVSLLDAVANQKIGEVWTNSNTVANPYNSSYYCFVSRIGDYFTSLENTWFYQIAGGADVVPVVGTKYHSFYFPDKSEHWKFKWVDRDHFGIGRDWNDDTAKAQLVWLSEKLKM